MRLLLILLFSWLLPSAMPVISKDRVSHIKSVAVQDNCRNDYAIFMDMSRPSDEKRWYVVDLATMNVIYDTYVAHGKGSGEGKQAEHFSDTPGSDCTALGIYKITGTYAGKHGLSYALCGLEPTNKNAQSRSIVIHSAWYATNDFVSEYDRCGNSWGCPAISPEALKACAPYLKPGTLLWIYR